MQKHLFLSFSLMIGLSIVLSGCAKQPTAPVVLSPSPTAAVVEKLINVQTPYPLVTPTPTLPPVATPKPRPKVIATPTLTPKPISTDIVLLSAWAYWKWYYPMVVDNNVGSSSVKNQNLRLHQNSPITDVVVNEMIIKNESLTAVEKVNIKTVIDGKDSSSYTIDTIQPNEEKRIEPNFRLPTGISTYHILIQINPEHTIQEKDYANNQSQFDLTIE